MDNSLVGSLVGDSLVGDSLVGSSSIDSGLLREAWAYWCSLQVSSPPKRPLTWV